MAIGFSRTPLISRKLCTKCRTQNSENHGVDLWK